MPNNYPALVVVKSAKDWKTVMAWIGSLFGGQQPDQATVRSGIREFIMAIKFTNCDYDDRMEKALLPKH